MINNWIVHILQSKFIFTIKINSVSQSFRLEAWRIENRSSALLLKAPFARTHTRTHARNRKDATHRRKAQLSARGCDGCAQRCADACRKASCIIYSVLSPGGPSVMAVLCPIKITAGAPRRAHRRLGGPTIELIYSPNIRLDLLHFVTELAWRPRPLRMEIGDRRCSTWTVIAVKRWLAL